MHMIMHPAHMSKLNLKVDSSDVRRKGLRKLYLLQLILGMQ